MPAEGVGSPTFGTAAINRQYIGLTTSLCIADVTGCLGILVARHNNIDGLSTAVVENPILEPRHSIDQLLRSFLRCRGYGDDGWPKHPYSNARHRKLNFILRLPTARQLPTCPASAAAAAASASPAAPRAPARPPAADRRARAVLLQGALLLAGAGALPADRSHRDGG